MLPGPFGERNVPAEPKSTRKCGAEQPALLFQRRLQQEMDFLVTIYWDGQRDGDAETAAVAGVRGG